MDTTLKCWIYGQAVDRRFDVTISETATVISLKQRITNVASVSFHGVDSHTLDLYSISDEQDSDKLKGVLKEWRPEGKPRLNIRSRVSDLRECIIIVDGPSHMTLSCWVRGQGPDNVFSVEILSTKTISILKEAIREKKLPEFHGIAADALILYSIPSPSDAELENTLKQWNPTGQNRLSPLAKLSTLGDGTELLIVVDVPSGDELLINAFRRASDRHLRFPGPRAMAPLIAAPEMTLNCWVRGQGFNNVFSVKISNTKTVGVLKKAIREQKPVGFRDVDADSLALYKVSLPCDQEIENVLRSLTLLPEQLLLPVLTLSNAFPDVPVEGHIHVVIEPPPSCASHSPFRTVVTTNPQAYIVSLRGEKRPREVQLMMDKTKRARLGLEASPYVSQPANFRQWHDMHHTLVDHRHDYNADELLGDKLPHSQYPPISLQYEGFGHFLDVFRGREDVPGMKKVPSATLRDVVDNFAEAMSLIFDDEFARRSVGLDALNEIVRTLTDRPDFCLMPAEISPRSSSDGQFLGPHGVASCLVKFKNEPGTGTCIPYVEMVSYFGHSINRAMMSPGPLELMMGWNVPCLGITVVGFYVTFFAMVFVGYGQWRVVSLTPALSCIGVSGDGDDRAALYKAFKAAAVLFSHIHEKATQLTANPPLPIHRSRALPYVSSLYDPRSASRIEFEIDEPYFSDGTGRLIYFATTTHGRKIMVKFTRRYSYDLHVFCADSGCAPALLGFERLPGGFLGVAMDFAESFAEIACFSGNPKTKEWAKMLQELVKSFHGKDLVHGDLRSPNVMCDGDKVMLVDFDLGGKAGEVSYPDVQLASDLTVGRVGDDLTITKNDDLRVLCRTLRYLGLGCDYCGH